MIIIRDTREQRPFDFSSFPVSVREGTLDTGDYSLFGFENDVAVERKSLQDLIGSLTTGRDRFMRELRRLRGYSSAVLVCENPLASIRTGMYRSKVNPVAIEQSVISIMQEYRLPIYFACGRGDAEQFVYNFLRHFQRHAEQHYRALERSTVETADDGLHPLKSARNRTVYGR